MRNIGIFAHVDAGKTTLSEQLLLHAGMIRSAGSVDSGTAHTDSLPVEQRRGISVKATCVRLSWRGEKINLIDTPGHTDFSGEIERSLWALDGAVIVVSGAEGVQPQTELLFEALRAQEIPLFFFVNKMDREGADLSRVEAQIRRRVTDKALIPSDMDRLLEAVCDADNALMESYLAGNEIPDEELSRRLPVLAREGAVYPVLAGSARRRGVDPLDTGRYILAARSALEGGIFDL